MRTLTLARVSHDGDGTYGVLIDGTKPFAVTLELPWRFNQKEVSCIPAATYLCKRVKSPRFGDTFEITNVRGRTHVLFHKGNRTRDSKGCILVAEEYGELGGEFAVLSSARGFDEFMAKLKGWSEFMLEIKAEKEDHPISEEYRG